jgi:transposase
VYEAGYCGFWIHDELRHLGIDCIVTNPADVPTSDKERRHKTDRVDAGKLARHHRSKELRGIYVPERCRLEDRTLVRTRARFVRKQTRCKHQIKSLLHFYGCTFPDELVERHWSGAYIRWLETVAMERSSGTESLQALLKELLFLRELITRLTRQIRALSHQELYARRVQLLCTIPGISIITAMTLLTELVTIDRFRTLDELASYAGLVPGERSSGEEEHHTGISPRRNAAMRHMLIESAWVAARQDPALMMAFSTLAHRMPKNQAIVRIARKLLNRIRYVLKNEQSYVKAVLYSA